MKVIEGDDRRTFNRDNRVRSATSPGRLGASLNAGVESTKQRFSKWFDDDAVAGTASVQAEVSRVSARRAKNINGAANESSWSHEQLIRNIARQQSWAHGCTIISNLSYTHSI